ncbi:MAG: hypothetical protein FJ306_13310 [Planctomycetes bacterium]|nr:hypothetical protein [Planctomycetota bacterium]
MKVLLFSALTLLACARQTSCDGTMTDDSWAAMRQCEADMARAARPADKLRHMDALVEITRRPKVCRSGPRGAGARWELIETDADMMALHSPPAGPHVNFLCDSCKSWTGRSGVLSKTPSLVWRRL